MGNKSQYDKVLILIILMLVSFGVIMIFSASSAISFKDLGDEFHYFKRQLAFAILGFIVMGAMIYLDYHVLREFVYPIFLVSLVFLILVIIPGVGREINGAHRWLGISSISFQPTEFVKLALILYLAYSLTKKDEKIRTLTVGFLPHIVLLLIIASLIMLQPDFGAAITIGIIVFIMLFNAGTRPSYIVGSVIAIAPIVYYAIVSVDYRLDRITAFINPWKDPLNTGYHIIQSFLALGSGGLVGMGLGEGTQKLFYLPYAYSDFIFAVIGEELGFIGVVILICAFSLFTIRGIRASRRAPDLFGTYLALGITALISVEVILNLGVVTGLFPTKGMTLPFISYGGSSLLACMTGAGILINISGQGGEK